MLNIVVPGAELWDEKKQEFVSTGDVSLQLEHSLLSISKWESKWHTPFLVKKNKTREELLDYIRCMTITPNVDPITYLCLTEDNVKQIRDYIDDPMTATTFSKDEHSKPSREVTTSEVIYYWMVSHNIQFECQKWHISRLLTLIRVCNVKNAPPKRRSKRDIASQYAALNAARRKQLNTRG